MILDIRWVWEADAKNIWKNGGNPEFGKICSLARPSVLLRSLCVDQDGGLPLISVLFYFFGIFSDCLLCQGRSCVVNSRVRVHPVIDGRGIKINQKRKTAFLHKNVGNSGSASWLCVQGSIVIPKTAENRAWAAFSRGNEDGGRDSRLWTAMTSGAGDF